MGILKVPTAARLVPRDHIFGSLSVCGYNSSLRPSDDLLLVTTHVTGDINRIEHQRRRIQDKYGPNPEPKEVVGRYVTQAEPKEEHQRYSCRLTFPDHGIISGGKTRGGDCT